jgi:hypothetical protein
MAAQIGKNEEFKDLCDSVWRREVKCDLFPYFTSSS